jgi:hypothetical protein
MVAMRIMIQANEQANNPERIPTTIKALAFKKVVVLLLKKINNKKSDIKHYKNTYDSLCIIQYIIIDLK